MHLRSPGAVLLVSCYELGRQPIALASARGFLVRAGYEPASLDLAVDCFDEQAAARARLVAISVPMHTALRLGVEAARRVRRLAPSAHICLYGHYAWLNADFLLGEVCDSVIGGECESPLVSLAEQLDRGKTGPLEGVWTRATAAPPHLRKLAFPSPSREGLPGLGRYARLDHQERLGLVGAVEASRGCLHHCRHCPIPPVYDGRFFVVPRQTVLADVAQLVAAGATHVTFADPDFFCGPGHAMEIARRMRDAHPQLTFDATIKVSHIIRQADRFEELGRLGCLFVVSAVESLSDTVLTMLDKGHTRADVFDALEILEGAGIWMRPSLVAFTPWTTLGDYLELVEVVGQRGLVDQVDPVQFSVRLLVPPGSRLLELPRMRAHLGPLDQAGFAHTWRHPDPRMDALHQTVSGLVEQASRTEQDPRETYRQIALAARSLAGLGAQPPTPTPEPSARPPRLTESWFC